MLSAEQIRAARALLGWSADLSWQKRSELGATTLRRYELDGVPVQTYGLIEA